MNDKEKNIAAEVVEQGKTNSEIFAEGSPAEHEEFMLNDESDLGISSSSVLVAEHKYVWTLKEFLMVAVMVIGGTLMSIFIKPVFFGLMLVVGGIGMALLNQSKKKTSVLQLYQTPKGLRVYHKGELSSTATTSTFLLEQVGEVNIIESNSKSLIVLKGNLDSSATKSASLRMPVRLVRSPGLSLMLDKWILDPSIKVHKSVVELQTEFKKMDRRG
jgi:hypothetical protein